MGFFSKRSKTPEVRPRVVARQAVTAPRVVRPHVPTNKNYGARHFEAAQQTQYNWGWDTGAVPYNQEIVQTLSSLRGYNRDLEKNNDHVRRAQSLLVINGAGPDGIKIKPQFKNRKTGLLLEELNSDISYYFNKVWCRKGNCEVTEKYNWVDILSLVLKSMSRDGEAFVNIVYDRSYKHGMALQLLDAAMIDHELNVSEEGKNKIVMGIEINRYGKPLAYYVKDQDYHSTNMGYTMIVDGHEKRYRRVPAKNMIHLYIPDRMQQTRGLSWIRTPLIRMLNSFLEAELIASRLNASSCGFFTRTNTDVVDPNGGGQNAASGMGLPSNGQGQFVRSANPASFTVLPDGYSFQKFDSDHPNQSVEKFTKVLLRGIASGINISYESLSGDLEGVSYSSIRTGLISERDFYKYIHKLLIENFCIPVYQAWLIGVSLKGVFNLPIDLEPFLYPEFQARIFQWVDPLKETTANVEAIKGGFKTITTCIQETGRTIEEVIEERAHEVDLIIQNTVKILDNAGFKENSKDDNFKGYITSLVMENLIGVGDSLNGSTVTQLGQQEQ